MPLTTAQPAKVRKPLRPVKAANVRAAVEAAAAYSAYNAEHKAKPAAKDWNKLVQQIGLSIGYLRVPYSFGVEMLPVWTAAYKAAQKGHVPARHVEIPPKVEKVAEAAPKSEALYTEAQVAKAVAAAIAALRKS